MKARALVLLLVLVLGPVLAGAEPRAAAASPAAAAPAASEAAALAPPPSAWQGAARVALALAAVVILMLAVVGGYRWLLGLLRPPARGAAGGRRGWFSRWILPGHDGDRVDVLARSWVGAKESVCLIRAGNERFLVGVTTARVSLLGRLDAGVLAFDAPAGAAARSAVAADAAERPAADGVASSPAFARELAEAAERGAAPAASTAPSMVTGAAATAAPEVEPAAAPVPPGPPPVTEESIRAALTQTRLHRTRTRRPAPVEVHVG